MRTPYTAPSVNEFVHLFTPSPRGGGLQDIRLYSPYSQGGGLLSFLGGLAKRALPFLVKTIAPEGLNLAQNVLRDVETGQNIRQALKSRGINALRNVGTKIARGGGRRRRRKKPVKRVQKKKCFNDVFASI